MQIRILYFTGCPNHPPVVEMVRRVVSTSGVDATIEELEVAPDTVEQLRFLGSPTVQVDGVDIEPDARERTDFAMSCRVYRTPDGLPTESMLRSVLGIDGGGGGGDDDPGGGPGGGGTGLSGAGRQETSGARAGTFAIGGSVGSAALSSACCWLPLLMLSFGASAAGASAFFERWRLVFIAMALVGLALGFYFSYIRKPTCAAQDCCATDAPRGGRGVQRGLLWVSTIVVAAFLFFPSYVGLLLDMTSSTGEPGDDAAAVVSDDVSDASSTGALSDTMDPSAQAFVFRVEGMHCEGCASMLQSELSKLDGVAHAEVDYDSKTARLRAVRGDLSEAGIAGVAEKLGYTILEDDE